MDDVWVYITFITLGVLMFFTFIYPKYFAKGKGGKISNPLRRPSAILIDKNIPGGMAEIEARTPYDNGKMTLHLRNKNGAFIKDYYQEEVIPIDTTQVMVDADAPMFITRETKYSEMEYESDFKKMTDTNGRLISDRDYWKTQYNDMKANIDTRVEAEVRRALELNKPNKPDWQNK